MAVTTPKGEQMKPIVLYVEDGYIKITKEKLDKIISEAYEQGYADGKKTSVSYLNTITNPLSTAAISNEPVQKVTITGSI